MEKKKNLFFPLPDRDDDDDDDDDRELGEQRSRNGRIDQRIEFVLFQCIDVEWQLL